MAQSIWVTKTDISEVHSVELPLPALGEGAARLRVESFAVTANNVTYAVIGDMFGYWNFFPAQQGKGIVPMWGHAVVEASNHPGVSVGERVYGYLPMGTHLDILPGLISAGQLTDMSAHRQPMSPFYNQYARLAADPEHDPAREDARMIFGPLFKTGFLIEAMMRRESWFGADQVVMTSASSKTAMALAHCCQQGSPHVKRIGLTSAGNVDFVSSTGLYDDVVAYSGISSLATKPSVLVDFAGNGALLRAAHRHLEGQLRYSCTVGVTHIDARSSDEALVDPQPVLFFAPDHATATVKELGPKGFGQAVAQSWAGFVRLTDGFVSVDHRSGLQAAADAYLTTVKGMADPSVGIVIRP
jgi:Protein of unknown function (DUF2855)